MILAAVRPSALVALLAAVLLALAACGQLPRPFKPGETKEGVNLRALAYDSTVVVLPPDGDLPADPGPITEALRDALLAEGLIATGWQEQDGGLQLAGRAEVRPVAGGQEILVADWAIEGPEGPLARFRQRRALPLGAWQAGEPETARAVAAEVAAALAPQLLGPATPEAVIAGFPGARLAVLPVTGAPGDGDEALAASLRLALERAEVPLVEAPGGIGGGITAPEDLAPEDLAVRGTVETTPPAEGQQQVTIVWRLVDGSGAELGKIEQANAVPAGSLDGPWGRIATLVARGAAAGLTDLLDRLARQKAAG